MRESLMYGSVRWRGSAKARALATQPNLAVVGNACGGRTDFHGNFQLMLLRWQRYLAAARIVR